MEIRYLVRLFLVCFCYFFSSSVFADDGGITFGGTPHLLSGHPSVSMQSEVIKVDVHAEKITVDCLFKFRNSGKSCVVRMGFPDEGLGSEEPYQGEPVPTGPGLHAGFLSYESFVDGKKVPTKLVPTSSRSLYWHTKTVTFKANSTCMIHDIYTLKPGGQVTNENGLYRQTYYILHTGSSWHGPIETATISFDFNKDAIAEQPTATPLKSVENGDPRELKWSKLPAGTVLYDGCSKPELSGRTLTFKCNNFKPSEKDDIHVYYGYRKLTNM